MQGCGGLWEDLGSANLSSYGGLFGPSRPGFWGLWGQWGALPPGSVGPKGLGPSQVGQSQQQRQPIRVLVQAPVAYLGIAEYLLHVPGRGVPPWPLSTPWPSLLMLRRCPVPVSAAVLASSPPATPLPAPGSLPASAPRCSPHLPTPVAPHRAIADGPRSRPCTLADVVLKTVHQARLGIHPSVQLHPEVVLIALLGLSHLRVPLPSPVLGGRRRLNDGGVYDGSLPQTPLPALPGGP